MDARGLTDADFEALVGRTRRVIPDDAVRPAVAGRRVLVTGAGGTIGGALVRRAAELEPEALFLLGHGEDALHRTACELAIRCPGVRVETILADVRDRARLRDAFREASPDLVVHAAAVKHVPLAEEHPGEAILTNIVGTRNVLEACEASTRKVSAVLISTDKAVQPSGIMGQTKRVAELLFASGGWGRRKTSTRTVRLGNVLGASGSVLLAFERRLAAGLPLQVTHPEIRRYFIHVREAVDLILASAAGSHGTGRTFLLDMGEPVRILDLATRFRGLRGLQGLQGHPVELTGLRFGDRMDEPLTFPWELAMPSKVAGVREIPAEGPRIDILSVVDPIEMVVHAGNIPGAMGMLDAMVLAGDPGWKP